ncbi:MAG: hypothetical protein PHQ23_03640 [Candidatus Wallbacteria bacterium]|nr:hypothetical protein [Candidatus Wallbacteria bacterium]
MTIRRNDKRKALVAIDWFLIALLIALTCAVILPDYYRLKNKLSEAICTNNREMLKDAIKEYLKKYPYLRNTRLEPKLLLDVGYLDKLPECPKGGVYDVLIDDKGGFKVLCKVHGS